MVLLAMRRIVRPHPYCNVCAQDRQDRGRICQWSANFSQAVAQGVLACEFSHRLGARTIVSAGGGTPPVMRRTECCWLPANSILFHGLSSKPGRTLFR